MINTSYRSLFILLVLSGAINAQEGSSEKSNSGDVLYDNSYLHVVKIDSDDIPDVWDAINRDYIMVTVEVDGNTLDSVGIRLKGFTSANSSQKPLKIDTNKYVSGKKLDGVKEFNLHNNFKDPYLQREAVAYNLYRRAGLPSPRTSYAEVFVDGIFRGIYAITEPIGKDFLKHNFSNSTGSLYKGPTGFAGRSVELKDGTMDEYSNFEKNVTPYNLGEYVNLDHYLKHLAVDIIIGDWDSYAYDRHNYYIYYEPTSERLNFINWDHNYAFSADEKDIDLYPRGTFPTLSNLIEEPTLRSKYEQTMCELLTYVVDHLYIKDITTHNYMVITSSSQNVQVEDPSALTDYIALRNEKLTDALSGIGASCDD